MLLFALITACAPSDSLLGADALTELDTLRTMVDDHVVTAHAATSMDDIDTLEPAHTMDMASAMDDMDGMMSTMMDCSMSDMMNANMGDADAHMSDMMDEVTSHGDAHANHADMQDCWDEEDAYQDSMHEHLDGMNGDMGSFDDDASCSESGGMM